MGLSGSPFRFTRPSAFQPTEAIASAALLAVGNCGVKPRLMGEMRSDNEP
jgi:hypothetical protein